MMRKQPPPPKKQTKSIQSQKKGRESEKLAPEIKKSPELYFEDLQLEPHQEQIVSVVQEYLLRYNLLQTLETLQREILNGQMGQDSGRLDCDLLEFFEKGEQELFFAQWNKYIPYAARMRDEQIKKLEFYIQIYFLIYDIHPKTGKRGAQIPRNTIAFFKGYLESKGQELSKTNEFLHYYALPYVPKPQEHPSYKHLFSNQWLLEIKGSLVKTINDLQARDQPTVLEQICGQYEEGQPKKQNLSQSNQNYTTQLEINNQELLSVIQDYNLKYNQMQKKFRDYIEQSKQTMIEAQQKWYQTNKEVTDIAKELNKMLEESRNGKQIQQNKLDELLKKLTSLSKFFSTSVEEIISQSHDISLYDKGSIFDNDLSMSPIPQHVSQQNHFNFQNIGNVNQNQNNNTFTQLNYPKIQHFFLDPSTDPGLVCRVLQALRFRITTSKGARLRREILIQYAQFDIIGCTPRNAAVLHKLLVESSNQIKEYTLRLTNTMASDYQGRSYLMDSLQLIRILIDILKKEHTDSLVRRNALGALQKLSLRRKPQIVMIENDVIKWIVKTLKDEKDTLSEYSYEYATALFMNLSMRFQGKKKCEDFKQEVLKVLNDLLENENMQVRTFVNGTLYSLFSIQTLREQANAFGMNQRLNALMQTSDERFIRQIQYIIEQLNRDGPDEEENDEENDVDDIDDIDDSEDTIEEDDVEDALQNNKNELMGEDLLSVLFCLTQQEAQQQNSLTRSILQEQKKTQQSQQQLTPRDQPFRPTTPVMQASQLQKSERSNPSEMKSRPKVMRTPVANERNIPQQQQQQQDQLQESQPVPQPIQPVLPKHDPPAYEQNPDYKQAFEHKPKLPRTPPGGKR